MSVTLPGDQPESVTLKSTSECVCSKTECVCVTRCADSINENMHFQGACDTGEDFSEDSAETACDKDGVGHVCAKLSECELMCDERERAESSMYKNLDECVFAGPSVAEILKRNACESEKVSVSTKERVFVVEKEGCATVVMYPERCTAHVFLADGTVTTGNNQGDYQVSCLS